MPTWEGTCSHCIVTPCDSLSSRSGRAEKKNLGNVHNPLGTGKHFFGANTVKFTAKLVYGSLTAGAMALEVSYRNRKVPFADCGYE